MHLFLFSDLIERNLWAGNHVAAVQRTILDFNVNPEGVISEDRVPPE